MLTKLLYISKYNVSIKLFFFKFCIYYESGGGKVASPRSLFFKQESSRVNSSSPLLSCSAIPHCLINLTRASYNNDLLT